MKTIVCVLLAFLPLMASTKNQRNAMNNIDSLKAMLAEKDTISVGKFIEAHPQALGETDSNGTTGLLLIAYHGNSAPLLARAISLAPALNFYEAIVAGRIEQVRKELHDNNRLLNAYGPDGFTPIALACFFEQYDVAKMLLDAGADPDIAANNISKVNALHAAVAKNNAPLCALLIQMGANVNAPQMSNVTALHSAAHRNNLEIVTLLVENGADVDAKMDNGDTALMIAVREGKAKVSGYLEQVQ